MFQTKKGDDCIKMTEQRELCSLPLLRTPKLQLDVEQPSIRGFWNPPKKYTPCPKKKKKPQQDG